MQLSILGRRKRPSVAPQAAIQTPPRIEHWLAPAGTLGQRLLTQGLISLQDLQFALLWQRSLSGDWPVHRLGSLLVKAGIVGPRQLAEVLSAQRGVAAHTELPRQVLPWLREIFPGELLRQVGAVPLYIAGRTLVVGMIDPHRQEQVAALQSHTGYTVQPVLMLQLHQQKLLRSMPTDLS